MLESEKNTKLSAGVVIKNMKSYLNNFAKLQCDLLPSMLRADYIYNTQLLALFVDRFSLLSEESIKQMSSPFSFNMLMMKSLIFAIECNIKSLKKQIAAETRRTKRIVEMVKELK